MVSFRHHPFAFCLIALPICIACGTSPAARTQQERGSELVSYRLSLLPDHTGWSVTARFPPRFSGKRLCAPAIGTRWGEALEWRGLRTEAGTEAVTWDREGCFEAPTFGTWVEVEYRARTTLALGPAWRASSLSPRAWSQEGHEALFFPGEALFVEPMDPTARGVPVVLNLTLPTGWSAASTLAGAERVWSADGARALISSALWVGNGSRGVSSTQDTRVWIDDRVRSLDAEQILVDARCISGQLESWRGRSVTGLTEAPRSTLLVLDAPWDRDARAGFARADGAVLQVGQSTALDEDALRSLIAHELFHRINGDEIRYADDDYSATTWFREGATSYVALITLGQAGLLDEAGFRRQLAGHASSYLASPVLRDPTVEGDARRRFEYDRGVLLSLALDVTLRELSEGSRSLAGFFLHLVRERSAGPLQSGDLESALDRYSGVDVSAFFTGYVRNGVELPVHALLRNVGFEVVPSSSTLPDLGMWVRYDTRTARLEVAGVTAAGAAATAGIGVGDEVLPLSDHGWSSPEAQTWWVRSARDRVEREVELVPIVRVLPAVELEVRDDDPISAWRTLLAGPRSSTCVGDASGEPHHRSSDAGRSAEPSHVHPTEDLGR